MIMQWIIKGIAAFIAMAGFGVLLEVPKKFVLYSGIIGIITWFVYEYMVSITNSVIMQTFVPTLVVASISHICARMLKCPVTVLFVVGILALVPGGFIYQSIYSYIRDDYVNGNYNFIQTLQVAGAISMAIFLMDSFFRSTRRRNRHKFRR